jgi:hypothetical protein
MLERRAKRLLIVLLFVAGWLVFEFLISWLATCQEINYGQSYGGREKINCTFFAGPLALIAVSIWKFLGANEHELIAGFTIVLGLSTIGLWLSTRDLWDATRRGAQQQEKDTQILQRAYLSVEPGGVAPYASPTATFDPDWRVVAHIRIHNAGHLPARNVSYHFNTQFSSDPHWSEERLAQIDWSEDFFAQSGETENAVEPVGNNVIPPGSTMNQGGPTRLLGEKGWVYVWGIVTYNDGFVDGRITRFCHRYNLKRSRPSKDGSRRIRPKYGRYYERGQDST